MALPPSLWAELFFDGTWNDITPDVRQTAAATVTRGQTSESGGQAPPTASSLVLNNRSRRYAPRNPRSELYGKIGRNTPLRWGYREGSPWVQSDGTGTGVLTTPTQSVFNVTDLDVRLDIALDSWETQQALASRYTATGNQRSWGLYLAGTGQIALVWSATGSSTTITQFSTASVPAYNGQRLTIRVTLDVDNGAGGYTLKFFTGRTVDDEEYEWTQLGDAITGGATTALFAASSQIEFGDLSSVVLNCLTGKGYAMKLMTSIGGSTAMRMTTQDASPGRTSFTSGGLVWTVTGTGVSLSNRHVRMSGEVPEWPGTRDRSGNDASVTVAPTDITRRMDSGSKPVDSGLLRYIQSNNPVEFWPLIDGPTSLSGRNFVTGGQVMSTGLTNGTILPEWAKGELATGLEPVFAAKKETSGYLKADTRNAAAAAASWSVDWFLRTEAQGDIGTMEIRDRGLTTDADNLVYFQITANQTDDTIVIFRFLRGETTSSFALVSTINAPGIFDGQMHMLRFAVDPGATNTDWVLYVDGVAIGSGTISSIVVKAVSRITYTWSLETSTDTQKADELIGFITYWDSTGPSAATVWGVATGLQGERAGTRAERVAGEGGYTLTSYGQATSQQRMGVQTRKKLPEVLADAAKTDFGYVLGSRDRLEAIFRSASTLWNQHPALTLDFSAGLLSDYKYRDDDLLTQNDVTVTREGGSSSRQVLEEGTLSVQDFPNGVGRYDVGPTYSLYTDEQAAHTAYMLLHLGTFDGIRYTRITLDLANPRVQQLLDDILRTDVGDLIRLTNLPQEQGADNVDSLVVGYREEAGPTSWKITFICVPAEPFNGLMIEVAGRDRFDTGGCQLSEALDETETAVDVLTTGQAPWINAAPVLNDNSSFDTGITGWSAFGGATIAWDPARGVRAPGCIALTTTGAASPRAEGPRAAVTAGQQYVLSGWLYTDVALGVAANVSVNWYTAASGGSYISTSSVSLASLPAGTWTYFQTTVTAPATAAGGGVLTSLSGTPAAGLVWRGDDLELRDYLPNTYPADFPFDVITGGEVMRVTACTGTTLSQTFTVTRAINGVRKTHASGQPVALFVPVYFQL
ncbi:hypothetical protein ACIQJT_02475 [Streptomyces sp. NPDC091972]|uniref:hypothetical protein n=1 Tax=Streptomyces sp. NPDC091972 TaxID=3366007 RepID=UPI00380532C9